MPDHDEMSRILADALNEVRAEMGKPHKKRHRGPGSTFCPGAGPTAEGAWPISSEVIDAGVRAYDKNYGPHGIRETLMAVWNEMHRAMAHEALRHFAGNAERG